MFLRQACLEAIKKFFWGRSCHMQPGFLRQKGKERKTKEKKRIRKDVF